MDPKSKFFPNVKKKPTKKRSTLRLTKNYTQIKLITF